MIFSYTHLGPSSFFGAITPRVLLPHPFIDRLALAHPEHPFTFQSAHFFTPLGTHRLNPAFENP
jgi:hypothetical protein